MAEVQFSHFCCCSWCLKEGDAGGDLLRREKARGAEKEFVRGGARGLFHGAMGAIIPHLPLTGFIAYLSEGFQEDSA